MSRLLPRTAWTRTAPGWNRSPRDVNPKGIAAHWPGGAKVGRDADVVAAALRAYRSYHVDTRGWPDIGYNYGVDQAGRCWTLAGERQAAHCASDDYPTANVDYYGLLFIVGTDEALSDDAIDGFRWLRANVLGKTLDVVGHQDVPGASTACPGKSVMAAIADGKLTASGGSSKPSGPKQIAEDGVHGSDTTTRLQEILTEAGYYDGPIDAKISRQPAVNKSVLSSKEHGLGLGSGWQWLKDRADYAEGSPTIKGDQRRLRDKDLYTDKIDGWAGPNYWRAVQTEQGTPVDGEVWRPSSCVRSRQEAFNAGKVA